jgi:DNA-binding ferritin-like protein
MSNVVNFFFQLSCNLKLYHWQTTSFSRHNAADKLFERVNDLADQYMESHMGRYGRPRMSKKDTVISLKEYSDDDMVTYLKACLSYLQGPLTKSLKDVDTDLVTIKDDLISELTKTLYLFTLQ